GPHQGPIHGVRGVQVRQARDEYADVRTPDQAGLDAAGRIVVAQHQRFDAPLTRNSAKGEQVDKPDRQERDARDPVPCHSDSPRPGVMNSWMRSRDYIAFCDAGGLLAVTRLTSKVA